MVQQSSVFTALYDERKKKKNGAGGGKPKIDLLGNQSRADTKIAKNMRKPVKTATKTN